jgi:hypothetical protein
MTAPPPPSAARVATPETSAAFRELLDLLRDADRGFLDGPRAVADPLSALEGYRWLTEVLSVALDCYLWADPARPEFVKIVGPTRKWGGDNPDAFYDVAPLDPARSYRVRGRMGDACYLSLCVYGGPRDGRWSERIVASINDRQIRFGPERSFELLLSARPQQGNWLRLEPDAVCAVTRDYLLDPERGRQASYRIECLDPVPPPPPLADAELARRLRCSAGFLRDLLSICPLPAIGEANAVQEPYRQQAVTRGWAAPDVVYAMGRYELGEDEVLVLEGRSPRCAFWNLCLWNPFLQTFDYRYQRVALNGGQVRAEADGSWRILVSARDPGHPNWISTAGHPRGVLWFRWFLAEQTPPRPAARVAQLGTL